MQHSWVLQPRLEALEIDVMTVAQRAQRVLTAPMIMMLIDQRMWDGSVDGLI